MNNKTNKLNARKLKTGEMTWLMEDCFLLVGNALDAEHIIYGEPRLGFLLGSNC